MRRHCRTLFLLCASALLLTACGGAGEEEAESFPTFPNTQEEQAAFEGRDSLSALDGANASTISGEPDAQAPNDEADASSSSGEPDAPSAPEGIDAPSMPGQADAPSAPEGIDAPPVSGEPDETPAPDGNDAQLSGEILSEAKAMGEGVGVGTLAYDVRPDSCEVYLPEGAQYVPFLVLSADYGGNALLLRRDVLPEFRPFNNYSAAYEDSAIDRFLSGEYLRSLDAVRDLIRSSEIVVTDADALGASGNEVGTLTRNVFLLSCTETGFTELANAGKEGAALSYFDAPEHRAASLENGRAASWWLRTPDTYYLSAAYGVGPDGTLGSGNAYNENGVRPALCVPSDALAFPTEDIVAGQTVYFLSP